jgi:hypothetical protein
MVQHSPRIRNVEGSKIGDVQIENATLNHTVRRVRRCEPTKHLLGCGNGLWVKIHCDDLGRAKLQGGEAVHAGAASNIEEAFPGQSFVTK